MGCVFCGGGDAWIKTCRLGSEKVRVCDPCWEITGLVIVPGPVMVATRCDICGHYLNPREMAQLHPGGRWGAFSGVCRMCRDA